MSNAHGVRELVAVISPTRHCQGVWLMPAHPGVNELNSLTEIIVTVMTLSWLSDSLILLVIALLLPGN